MTTSRMGSQILVLLNTIMARLKPTAPLKPALYHMVSIIVENEICKVCVVKCTDGIFEYSGQISLPCCNNLISKFQVTTKCLEDEKGQYKYQSSHSSADQIHYKHQA